MEKSAADHIPDVVAVVDDVAADLAGGDDGHLECDSNVCGRSLNDAGLYVIEAYG